MAGSGLVANIFMKIFLIFLRGLRSLASHSGEIKVLWQASKEHISGNKVSVASLITPALVLGVICDAYSF